MQIHRLTQHKLLQTWRCSLTISNWYLRPEPNPRPKEGRWWLEVRRKRRHFDVRGLLYPLRHDSDSDQRHSNFWVITSHKFNLLHPNGPQPLHWLQVSKPFIHIWHTAYIRGSNLEKKGHRQDRAKTILASWLLSNNGRQSYMVEPCRR